MGIGSEADLLKCIVPCMPLWKEEMSFSSFVGHLIFSKHVNRPLLLNKSKTLVRSIKLMYRCCLCPWHFSCSCLSEIISIVDLSALKPHSVLEYACSASVCSLFNSTQANVLPVMLSRAMLLKLLESLQSPLYI